MIGSVGLSSRNILGLGVKIGYVFGIDVHLNRIMSVVEAVIS